MHSMVNTPRLWVPHPLSLGAEMLLAREQAHYVGNVMRLGPGASLALFNGRDGEWLGFLSEIRRDRAMVVLERQTRPQAPEPDLWLVFAPLKRDATDLVVQKATELGVSVIKPVFTARTNTARMNLERLAAIAREAAEQSERLTVPDILEPRKLLECLADWPLERGLAAAIERAGAAPVPLAAAALLVGPEGGFAPAELDALRAARFVSPLCLGPRVLRAETAVIAGLALLQGGRWSTT
jgi:16S rRNA (uracil1498-N3)-methyltransferase